MNKDQMAIFEEKMRTLIEEYREQVGLWGQEIKALCETSLLEHGSRKKCIKILHSIGGSAATYSFAEFGARARELEEALDGAADAALPSFRQSLDEFAAICTQISQESSV